MKTQKSTPVAILVRVSTNKQETSRQVTELTKYAATQGWNVAATVAETVSGDASDGERDGLNEVLSLAATGEIKKVLVHEISRIARRNSVAHKFIEDLEELKVSVYWHTQSVETLLPNGKRNPATSLMFAMLSEMARAEREFLRERILSGLEQAKRNGVKLGRPKGKTDDKSILAAHKDVVRLLKEGQSVRKTAKLTGKSPTTVQKVKVILAS